MPLTYSTGLNRAPIPNNLKREKPMNLKRTYYELKAIIDNLDFSSLWTGFKPLKFALYNDEECFFNGQFIPKTDAFIANTSIQYEGEYIAIWYLTQEVDMDILASKIIHEMFHGFQMLHQESRFPDDLEALITYEYSKDNLSIKLTENNLIKQLLKDFDPGQFNKLLYLRHYRLLHFPFEYLYESAVEQIEGTASFVELNTLLQIAPDKYRQQIKEMVSKITEPSNLFPIRIISYSIGALIFLLLKKHQLYSFEFFSDETITTSMLKGSPIYSDALPIFPEMTNLVDTFFSESALIIEAALSKDCCVLSGNYKLLGLNVYDAKYYKGHIISTHFLMYQDGESSAVIKGDFVICLSSGKTIQKVYKI